MPRFTGSISLPSSSLRCQAPSGALGEGLRAAGILSVFHYVPLHSSPMGIELGGRAGQCPVTESVSSRLVRLPLFFDITEAELASVVEAVKAVEIKPKAPLRDKACVELKS